MVKHLGRTNEFSELYDGKITPGNFSHYIVMELLPSFEVDRQAGRLVIVENLDVTLQDGEVVKYSGEIMDKKPHGVGSYAKRGYKIESHFVHGKKHGIKIETYTSGPVVIREMRNGQELGKSSSHAPSGVICNRVYDENRKRIAEKYVNPGEEFYSKTGKPNQALSANYRDFVDFY